MKFNEEFVEYLRNFNKINNNMNFVPGKSQTTVIGSPSGVLFFARVTTDVEITSPFAVSNLGNVLSILDELTDPSLEVQEGKLILSDAESKIDITLTKPEFIYHSKKPERYQRPDAGIEVELKWPVFERVRNIASTVKNDHLVFGGDGEKIYFGSNDFTNPTANKSRVNLGETTEIFSAVINKDVLRLHKSDYKVSIDKRGFVYLTNGKVEYFVPVLANHSKFGD